MADTVYTRVLMYKASNTKAQVGPNETKVALSSFTYSSGDSEHDIVKIRTIRIYTKVKRHNRGGYGAETWTGNLYLANVSTALSETARTECSMSAFGNVSVSFDISDRELPISAVQYIGSKPKDDDVCTYLGIQPLYVEITYTSEKYYLSIPNFDCYRCNSSGNISLRGSYCLIKAKYAIGVLAPSSQTISASFVVSDGTRSQTVKSGRSAVESSRGQQLTPWIFSPSSGGQTFQPNQDYTLTATLTYGDESKTQTFVLRKARAPFAFNNHSVGIGQYAQGTDRDERFDCSYPAYFNEGIVGVTTYQAFETGQDVGNESPTGGTWVDGKKMYMRVCKSPALGTGGTAMIDITDLNYDYIEIAQTSFFYAYNTTPGYVAPAYEPVGASGDAANDWIRCFINGSNLNVRCGTAITVDHGYIVLRYTKKVVE